MNFRTRHSLVIVLALGSLLALPCTSTGTPAPATDSVTPAGAAGTTGDSSSPITESRGHSRFGASPGNRQRRPPRERPAPEIDREELLHGDLDGDGVMNAGDPCWISRPGARTGVPGCTLLDLSQMPEPLARSLPDAIESALEQLEVTRGVEAIGELTLGLLPQTDVAASRIRGGDACAGARDYEAIEAEISLILDMFDPLLREAAAEITEPGDREDDVREVEQRVSELEFLQSRVAKVGDSAGILANASREVCDASVPGLSTRGVVERVDDASRRVILLDGRAFALGPEAGRGGFSIGQDVVIEGIDLGNGTGFAAKVTPDPAAMPVPGISFSCLRPRVAPIQPFPPVSQGPFLLHDLLAYRYDSSFPGITQVYRLEEGMRIGAERVCPGQGQSIIIGNRHSLAVHISYTSNNGDPKSSDLAEDLTPFSEPVPLPTDVDPAFPALLSVVHNVQSCQPDLIKILSCGAKKLLDTITYDLHIVDRGSMCVALYEKTHLDVDDRIDGQFRPTRVESIFSFAVSDGGSSPTFRGQGYSYSQSTGSSSFPSTLLINGQARFSIHSHDFYPIHGADSSNEASLFLAASGVNHAAGLMWPRALGFRNNRSYRYSCNLPTVVRDVVDFCPNKSTDAYYQMPFAMGLTNWNQGQGNLSQPGCMGPNCPTHANGYAYDMLVGCNNTIRAARGGRVMWVKENQQAQVEKWCCAGQAKCSGCSQVCCTIQGASCPHNELWIRHQDGTIGRYVHMPKDGVIPLEGDVVRRGQPLGTIGITGNTSGPHLHIEERNNGATSLALFEAANPSAPGLLQCYEPKSGDPLRSNNLECTSCPPQ